MHGLLPPLPIILTTLLLLTNQPSSLNSTSPEAIPTMAVTHGDLESRRKEGGMEVSSHRGLVLMVFSVLCGFASFVLCLGAEATRSEATWFLLTKDQKQKTYECYYSDSGRTPLICAALAFLMLAIAMLIEHSFIVMTVGSSRPPALVAWSLREETGPPASAARLRWEACALFLATWVCFAVSEVLLMIGISVEASHLTDWNSLKSRCVIARPGLFAAAGIISLATVFLAAALYLTALRAQRLLHHTQLHEARRHRPTDVDASAPPQHDLHRPQQPVMAGEGNDPRPEYSGDVRKG